MLFVLIGVKYVTFFAFADIGKCSMAIISDTENQVVGVVVNIEKSRWKVWGASHNRVRLINEKIQ